MIDSWRGREPPLPPSKPPQASVPWSASVLSMAEALSFRRTPQSCRCAISLPLSFGGTSYSTIARALAVCASSVVDDAGELRRRALDVEDGPGVPLLLFGRLLSHGSSHGTL